MKTPSIGQCKLCGEVASLTKEHIPPAGAYKGRPYNVQVLKGDKVLEGGRGQPFQRGFYERVLCINCNRMTGSWYGDEFTRWSRWGFELLEAPGQQPIPLVPAYEGYPLRIAKQVVSTMIAASQRELSEERPDLHRFVLNRDATSDPTDIRLHAYLCATSTGRSTGVAFAIKDEGASVHRLIEFALPPFGYTLSIAGSHFDRRPVDISWFVGCRYDERRIIDLPQIPVLPIHEAFPGDYRNKNEIRRDVITNILLEQGRPNAQEEAERILGDGQGAEFLSRHGESWDL